MIISARSSFSFFVEEFRKYAIFLQQKLKNYKLHIFFVQIYLCEAEINI